MWRRYQLLEVVGRGGMGAVWQAQDRLTARTVALKRVVLADVPQSADTFITLAYEFRALASLMHPNIVQVFDYGFDQERVPFYTMTFLEGSRPITTMRDAPLSTRFQLLVQILQALIYLHQRGVLHRDLKPTNILVQDQHVTLVDFGLAVEIQQNEPTNAIAGTLAYMAPELLSGGIPSIQSDLYSFGLIAHELLLGYHPFHSTSPMVLLENILGKNVVIESGDLPVGVTAIIERLLLKEPLDRYRSARHVLQELCYAADIEMPVEDAIAREGFLNAAQFVGRSAELDSFDRALEQLVNASGSAWLVGGESGIGKSRLMDEIRVRALIRGITVLRGQAIAEQSTPLYIWRDIVRMLLLMVEVSAEEVANLAEMIPDVYQITGFPVEPISIRDARAVHERFSILLVDLFRRALERHPLVLILEDLQWAQDSLEILRSLVGLQHAFPLLIIANFRDDEMPALATSLPEMTFMHLERLGTDHIQQLIVSMAGERVAETGVLDFVQRETEGNAFFIVEVMRALAESAGRIDDIGKSTLPNRVFAGGMRQLISRRLQRLPEWARVPLHVAAVNGRKIDLDILGTIFPGFQFDSWLRVCVDAAILARESGQWSFSHDKIREFMLDMLDPANKKQIHLQVGEAIERICQDKIKDYAGALVLHFHEAEQPEKEGFYAIQAAEYALTYHPASASNFVGSALRLIESGAYVPDAATRAHLSFVAGQASLRLSKYEAALEYLQKSLEIYQEIGSEYGIAQVQIAIGEHGYLTANFREAIARVEIGLPVMLAHEDWYQVATAEMNLGIIHSRLGDPKMARVYFVRCLENAERSANAVLIAKALNNLAISYDMEGAQEKALELHERSLSLRKSIRDLQGIGYSLYNLGAIQLDLGNLEEAHAYYLEAYQLFVEMGNRMGQANSLAQMAQINQFRGQYETAMDMYRQGLAMAQAIGDRFLEANTLLRMGLVHVAMEKWDDAIHHLRTSLTIFYQVDTKPDLLFALHKLADVYGKSGRLEHALLLYRAVRQHDPTYGRIIEIDEQVIALENSLEVVPPDKKLDFEKILEAEIYATGA